MATVASDGSLADVQAKHDAASDGDIITMPAGTFTWDARVNFTKQITLAGSSMFDGAGKTKIIGTGYTVAGNKWNFINWKTANSLLAQNDYTATLSDLELSVNNTTTGGVASILMGGTARVHKVGSDWKGGFRITRVRFTAQDPAKFLIAQCIGFQDWITGVVDHCWFNFSLASGGGGTGVMDMNHVSSPGYITNNSSTITEGGNTYYPGFGQNSYAREYKWGKGPGPLLSGGNADYDAIYIEDCLFEKQGIGITSTDAGSSICGGGRFVLRHCSLWPQTGGHQFGGTGNDASGYVVETYNNYYRAPATTTYFPHNCRGGAHVYFNERYEGPWNTGSGAGTIAGIQIDRLQMVGGVGLMVGLADGTNFFDKNARGTLKLDANHVRVTSGETYSFTPVSSNADSRVGSIYAQGSSSSHPGSPPNTWILNGLKVGAVANEFAGFTIRNKTLCTNVGITESDGAQKNTPTATAISSLINSSSAADGSGNVTITLSSGIGVGSPFSLGASEEWELRYIEQAIGTTGGTLIPTMNGRSNGSNGSNSAAFLASQTIDGQARFQYWCDQRGDGDWQWSNKWRATGGTWATPAFGLTSMTSRFVLGARHNAIRTIANAGDAHVTEDYPEIDTPTAENLRIGADPAFWGVQGPGNSFGAVISNPDGPADTAWGFTYPYVLVAPPPAESVIFLSGPGLSFGNVPVGQTKNGTLTVSNQGDVLLTVTSVSYPSAFTGLTTGFTVAAGDTHDITVTFTPLLVTTYTGNITVISDADSGTNTIAVSGTGEEPHEPPGHGRGKQKQTLARRA